MDSLFTAAMALREVDPDSGANGRVFEGELNEHWTIGPKVHGGAMLAMCANAARTAHGDSPGDDAGRATARGRAGQSDQRDAEDAGDDDRPED